MSIPAKIYPKTFENVFSEDNGRKFDFSNISIKDMSVDVYVNLFKNFLKDFSNKLFDFYVKAAWLKRKFFYDNKGMKMVSESGGVLDVVFSRFLRRIVGNDTQFFSRDFLYPKISSYFDLFFPEFNEGDPFKYPESYKFPFKNITIEFLAVVYQMDERMALLNIADEQKMTYAKFLDFVINQMYSANEELGTDKYIFINGTRNQNYVKKTDIDI